MIAVIGDSIVPANAMVRGCAVFGNHWTRGEINCRVPRHDALHRSGAHSPRGPPWWFLARSSPDLDHALVERYFPQVLTRGLSAEDTLWILCDHTGAVIKTGHERLVINDLKTTLEARFPGIRITDVTVSKITLSDGTPIEGVITSPLSCTPCGSQPTRRRQTREVELIPPARLALA